MHEIVKDYYGTHSKAARICALPPVVILLPCQNG
jgi:hypothetical protein